MNEWYLSLLFAVLIPTLAVLINGITFRGGIAAGVILFLSLYFGGYPCFCFLVFSFFFIAVIGKIMQKRHPGKDEIAEKTGSRDAVQVTVNGFAAALCTVLYYNTHDPIFLAGYFTAVAEALADSMASDIGVHSRRPPRRLLGFQKTEPGLSGGVSLLGTLSGGAGALLGAFAFALFYGWNLRTVAVIFLSAFAGMILDSLLGAGLQEKRRCTRCGKATEKRLHCGHPTQIIGGVAHFNNDFVNLLSNLCATLICLLLLYL